MKHINLKIWNLKYILISIYFQILNKKETNQNYNPSYLVEIGLKMDGLSGNKILLMFWPGNGNGYQTDFYFP